MSANIQTYTSKNELSGSLTSSVNVIELGHTSSIVRRFYVGDECGDIRLTWKMAISGSPSTGNLSTFYFFGGLCAGDSGKFSQSNNKSAHAMGLILNNNGDLNNSTFAARTHAHTDPVNQNSGFDGTIWAAYQRSGSFSVAVGYGSNNTLVRYDTRWSSSAGQSYPFLDNAFHTYFVQIARTTGSVYLGTAITTNNLAKIQIGGPNDQLHPMNVPKAVYDMAAEANSVNGFVTILNRFKTDVMGASETYAGNGGVSSGWVTNENESGSLNCINFYWRCDGSPQAKLLIKDIRIIRHDGAYQEILPLSLLVSPTSPTSSLLTWT